MGCASDPARVVGPHYPSGTLKWSVCISLKFLMMTLTSPPPDLPLGKPLLLRRPRGCGELKAQGACPVGPRV